MTHDANDRFEELLRDAAVSYNRPPADGDLPLEAMWQAIETEAFPAGGAAATSRQATTAGAGGLGLLRGRTGVRLLQAQWLRIAAALVIGVGIGRVSLQQGTTERATSVATSDHAAGGTTAREAIADPGQPFDAATSRYLGQAAALLIALPAETNTGRPDQRFLTRANELLVTTRLLLDSPTASEQGLRNLLEDLELVLVQVVRLEHDRDRTRRTELELIQQALDQRDVLPRLRTAVSEHGAAD